MRKPPQQSAAAADRQSEVQGRGHRALAKELPANVTLRERKGQETNCFILVVFSSNSSIIIKRKKSRTTVPKTLWVASKFLGTILKQ